MSHNSIEFNKDINSSNIKQYLGKKISILCHTPEDWDYLMKITETRATNNNTYIESSNKLFDLYDPSSVWQTTTLDDIIGKKVREIVNINNIYLNETFKYIDKLLNLIEEYESKT